MTEPPDPKPPTSFGSMNEVVDATLAVSTEPVMVLDLDGRLIAANQAASRLGERLGTPLANGSPVEPLFSRAPVVNAGGSPAWCAGAGGMEAFRIAAEAPPSSEVFELRSVLRHDDAGRPRDWLVQMADVTSLVDALRQGREAIEHRDRLLKLLSHDMRTPLAAILATLKHPDLAGAPPHLRELIEGAAHRALSMVDSNVRLIRAQCFDYTFVELDFSHVVEEAIDACWSLAKDAGIRIVLEPTSAPSPILADRGYLIEALNDLFAYLLERGVSGAILSCDLFPDLLDGAPAVTFCIRGAEDAPVAVQPLSSLNPLLGGGRYQLELVDGDGLNIFKTVVARHGGTVVGESESHRGIALTLPSVRGIASSS